MTKKRDLLIVSERYYPEAFLVNELSKAFSSRGLSTDVVTQIPSYPEDKVYSGYANRFFSKEIWEGLRVYRFFTVLGYKRNVIIKILNYLSFAFFTSLFALFTRNKYKKVLYVHTGPLTMAFSCIFWSNKVKQYIWTQDVWPDTVWAYGFNKTRINKFLLDSFVKNIYRQFNKIFVSSPGFIDTLKAYANKPTIYIPQWFPGKVDQTKTDSPFDKHKKNFVFAGNIGSVQNLENIILAFQEVSNDYTFHLVGDGSNLESLKKIAYTNNIKNVVFHGRVDFNIIGKYLSNADYLVISLVDKEIFRKTLPAKFQAYLAYGKPILAVIRGVVADYVSTHEIGVVAKPDSISDIEKKIVDITKLKNKNEIATKEKAIIEREFRFEVIMSKFCQEMGLEQ